MLLSIIIFSHLTAYQALPWRLQYFPKLRGIQGSGELSLWRFTQFQDSQELCQEYYAEWWKKVLFLRTSHELMKFMRPLRFPWPAPVLHETPVQSVKSYLGNLRWTPGLLHGIVEVSDCYTTCEDVRPPIELYIGQRIDVIQVRDREGFRMVCPETHYAYLVDVEDRREPYTDAQRHLDMMLLQIDPSYPGPMGWLERSVPMKPRDGTVRQCRCREHPFVSRVPAEMKSEKVVHAESSASCSDIQAIHSVDIHPYAEGATELEQAWTFWAELFPSSTDSARSK